MNESQKQAMQPSQTPRRALKLNAETLRVLETGENDPKGDAPQMPHRAFITPWCPQ
jgi:hypothetical protein